MICTYIDDIGIINSVGKFVTATQTKKGSVAFTIKDLRQLSIIYKQVLNSHFNNIDPCYILLIRDNVMDCTLWDALSVEFMNFYNSQSNVGRIVLILKHARVKEPQGLYIIRSYVLINDMKVSISLCLVHHIFANLFTSL
jgi:hypothetical protein